MAFRILGTVLVSWSIVVLAGLALEAMIWSWVSPFGTCLADAAQLAGLAVGPDLPPDCPGRAIADHLWPVRGLTKREGSRRAEP